MVSSHWILPAIALKRYATWFFAAPVDDDDVMIDDGEIVEMSWATLAAVLAKHHDGEIDRAAHLGHARHLTGHDTVASPPSSSTNAPPATTPPRSRGRRLPGRDVEGDAGYDTGDATVEGRGIGSPWPPTATSTKTTSSCMTTTITGLTAAEIAERVADGRVNNVPDAPVRSLGQIIANVLTPVNGIISTLFVLILIAGYPLTRFAGVVVSNSVIGIVQELQARRTLNELAVLSAPKARVRRDGDTIEVGISEVVADDILELSPGTNVVDGDVPPLASNSMSRCSPARAIRSRSTRTTRSWSACSVGRLGLLPSDPHRCRLLRCQALRGGTTVRDGRQRTATRVNIILRRLTFIIPPASVLLLLRQLSDDAIVWQDALQATVAAAVAMVFDGLCCSRASASSPG